MKFLTFLILSFIYSYILSKDLPKTSITDQIPTTISTSHEEVLESSIFKNVDNDGDGLLELGELSSFISKEISGQYFDEKNEIEDGTKEVMDNVLSSKSVKSAFVTAKDLASYWKKLGALLTVDEVADWVEYSVLLPQFASLFKSHAINGYDLPTLIEDNGKALEEDLGITSILHKKQLFRAIQMKLLGIGDAPNTPLDLSLESFGRQIIVSWNAPESTSGQLVPVHRYRVQKRFKPKADSKIVTDWSILCVVPATLHQCKDSAAGASASIEYRVEAWNLMGHSQFTGIKSIFIKEKLLKEVSVGASSFFKDVDDDNDGMIEPHEIKKFIGEVDDHISSSEIDKGAEDVIENILNVTNSKDIVGMAAKDLTAYWNKLGSSMTVQEVANWIEHAALLPQFVDNFKRNAISGYDLPMLIEDEGAMLEKELGITSNLNRKQIIRGIKMKLLAIEPSVPEGIVIDSLINKSIHLHWEIPKSTSKHVVPVHRYIVQRYKVDLDHPNAKVLNPTDAAYMTVCVTAVSNCIDNQNLQPDTIYSYKIQAWNLIGHGKYSEPKIVRTPVILAESYSELDAIFSPIFSTFGITPEFVQAVVTLLTLGGLVYAFFAFSLDTRIYNYFSGTVTETIVISSASEKSSNSFANWFMGASNSENVEVPKRRRHRERPKESVASMLAPEPSSVLTNDSSSPTSIPPLNLSKVLNSQLNPPVGISVSARNSSSSNSHASTTISPTDNTRGLTRGLSLSMIEKKTPGESELCFKCNHEFGFKDIKDISLNVGKWFRVRHFCSVCNRSFCSNCGKTSHKMAPCPVHGSCICAECDDLMTNSALKHVKRSDSGNSQSSQPGNTSILN